MVTVRNTAGDVVYREATPFLPQDNNYRSVGAIKVAGMASGHQLRFTGLFLPTAVIDPDLGPISVFPAPKKPALVLTVFEGTLFPDGRPQNVYSLGTQGMTQLRQANGSPVRLWLTPGATVGLPGGRGSITLDGVNRFAGVSVRHDPAKPLALAGAIGAMVGLTLSFAIRRRRAFITVRPAEPVNGAPCTFVEIGALAKSGDPQLGVAVDKITKALKGSQGDGS